MSQNFKAKEVTSNDVKMFKEVEDVILKYCPDASAIVSIVACNKNSDGVGDFQLCDLRFNSTADREIMLAMMREMLKGNPGINTH